MNSKEVPLADECSLCGLPMYHFQSDVADEPTDGEYRWAHEVCYTFSNAVERHHEEEVRNSSDEPRADGGQVDQSTDDTDRIGGREQVDWVMDLTRLKRLVVSAKAAVRREEYQKAHSKQQEANELLEEIREEYPRYIHSGGPSSTGVDR